MKKQKKLVAIGDIHGRSIWKIIAGRHKTDRIVFLGDYFDPYGNIDAMDMIENFNAIITLKKERPDDIILLLGNHDMHYIDDRFPRSSRHDDMLAPVIREKFLKNRDLFQYAFQEGDVIFTHAGICDRWFNEEFKGSAIPKEGEKSIADQLNNPSAEQLMAMYHVGRVRGGSDQEGGIFWADITETEGNPLKGYHQVVGHTQVPYLHEKVLSDDTSITYCDTLGFCHDYFQMDQK